MPDVLKNENQTPIVLDQVVRVRELSDQMGLSPSSVVTKLFDLGVRATINESIDFETAQIIAHEFGFQAEIRQTSQSPTLLTKGQKPRPPVVTVMGHVDHGKTKLLDAIRKSDEASKESGGITQSIGAYQLEYEYENKKRLITFIDTPGHEIFSRMRAHGASITDIVILVVAGDEGVKPQTIEAISHARAAQVPIIIAINKVDLPQANSDQVKRELASHGLISEDWGGKTPVVEVSAKERINIDQLLEVVLLTADLSDLAADPQAPAQGVVIDAQVESGLGPSATILITNGTLKTSQIVSIGNTWGKVRSIHSWRGQIIGQADPSSPVKISGLRSLPQVGDLMSLANSEKEARQAALEGKRVQAVKSVSKQHTPQDSTNQTSLKVILKTDVLGSLEAIKTNLQDISVGSSRIDFVQASVGTLGESDIQLAKTLGAVIFSFRTFVPKRVDHLAQVEGVDLFQFNVIYQLLDKARALLAGTIEPKKEKILLGEFEVIKSFFQISQEATVGGKMLSGELEPGLSLKLLRAGELIGQGRLISVRVGPQEVKKISLDDHKEAGLKIVKSAPAYRIKAGDKIEGYKNQIVQDSTNENHNNDSNNNKS